MNDEIYRADTVDDKETTVVTSNRESSGAICHTLSYHDTAYTGKTSMVYHLDVICIAPPGLAPEFRGIPGG